MSCVSGPPCAQGSKDKEEVPDDSHHDGHHIQGDPAPLVLVVDRVADQWTIITDDITNS